MGSLSTNLGVGMAETHHTGHVLTPLDQALVDGAAGAPCVALPLTSVDPVLGPSPELAVALAIQRAQHDEPAQLDDHVPARYAQLRDTPRRPTMRAPDPQFPAKTPAGRRSSRPATAPVGQPDPIPGTGALFMEQPRWAHYPDDSEVPSLPVRSPGAHMHPQLRRGPWTDFDGEAVSST